MSSSVASPAGVGSGIVAAFDAVMALPRRGSSHALTALLPLTSTTQPEHGAPEAKAPTPERKAKDEPGAAEPMAQGASNHNAVAVT